MRGNCPDMVSKETAVCQKAHLAPLQQTVKQNVSVNALKLVPKNSRACVSQRKPLHLLQRNVVRLAVDLGLVPTILQ